MRQKKTAPLLWMLPALLFLWPAMLNGFPFFYSDTATYLSSGFELNTPFDRPITYGLFLRLFSFNGLCIWTVVLAQCLLVAYLLHRFVCLLLRDAGIFVAPVILCLLALFTSLPWVCCLLLADVFTPVLLLCLVLILLEPKRNTLLYVLFTVAGSMHLSHLVFSVTLLVPVMLLRQRLQLRIPALNRSKIVVLLVLSAAAVVPGASAISKSGHVFTMGAMAEQGILKTFLDENCASGHYTLCAYKDSLPAHAYEFVWNEKSPLYKTGGWKDSREEYRDIIWATYTRPRYIWLHVQASVKATFRQLAAFKTGDGLGSYDSSTLLYQRMGLFLPNDFEAFRNSRQSAGTLGPVLNVINAIQRFVVLATLAGGIVLAALYRQRWPPCFLPAVFLLVAGIVLNAWNNGTFANVIDRLGCKMIWLVPLVFLLMVFYPAGKTRIND